MPAASTEQTAEQELKNLQALALSLQGVTPEYVGVTGEGSEDEQMARQIQQLDALDSELAAFERRFASADPQVKRMLAQVLSQDASSFEMMMHGNDTPSQPCRPVATPTSSDSAQTFPIAGAQHVSHCGAGSCPSGSVTQDPSRVAMPVTCRQGPQQSPRSSAYLPNSTLQTPIYAQEHRSPDEPMAIDVDVESHGPNVGGDVSSAAMFPAVTPANSLAQQAVQRDTLSDCAASLPMPVSNPPGVKNSILANQLRHRLHDMEHDMPHMGGSIRNTLTHISLTDPSLSSSGDRTQRTDEDHCVPLV